VYTRDPLCPKCIDNTVTMSV